jgi:AraC family transcriptional regulator
MTYSIIRKDLEPQRVLLARRRVKRSEIAATIGAVLTDVFQYAQQHGRAIAGHPFTRYIEFGAGLVTLEPGMKIVESAPPAAFNSASSTAVSATDAVVEEVLPGGPVMTTIHIGPYDTLPDAYAALESWMDSHEIQRAGAPWEYYITDPTDVPDPKDWKTEIFWPIV